MSYKKVRVLLLVILGGVGVVFMLVAGGLSYLCHAAPEAWCVQVGDLQQLRILIAVFGITGLGQLMLGVGLFVGMGRRERQREELFLYGTVVNGQVEAVRCNYAVSVNGRHPWYACVRCVHPITGQQITVRSHGVYDILLQEGDTVRVAFDPMNEKKYAVEMTAQEAWS